MSRWLVKGVDGSRGIAPDLSTALAMVPSTKFGTKYQTPKGVDYVLVGVDSETLVATLHDRTMA